MKGRRSRPFYLLANSSGSLAIFAAIRRASSFVSSLAAERHMKPRRSGKPYRPKRHTLIGSVEL